MMMMSKLESKMLHACPGPKKKTQCRSSQPMYQKISEEECPKLEEMKGDIYPSSRRRLLLPIHREILGARQVYVVYSVDTVARTWLPRLGLEQAPLGDG